ncbi:MAG TPA: hypothetical protein ENN35_07750, partial [Deltaproteobacteria bacterium]|nr:hypothetical protein [Deltaproteobacteria bacterium]
MEQARKQLLTGFRYGAILTVLLLGLVSIIGTGGGDATPVGGSPSSSGVFVNSPVEGLYYVADPSGLEGYTDGDGTFDYEPGDTVDFYIGDLLLGSSDGKDLVTPVDIVPGAADTANQAVTNIARLLQTLDDDGDLSNGIQITEETAESVSAAVPIDFDQSPDDFEADPNVAGLMADLGLILKTADEARENLNAGLQARGVVETMYGLLRASGPTDDTWQWLGVPYAKPPVGDLRWRPPQAPDVWEGIREATAWGDQAAQNPKYQSGGEGGMSEDCLYLNITAPRDAEDLPVMVYFHGGGFTILTGNTLAFNNPESLPTKDVILITVNHRLGPFGYLAHPDLIAESVAESGYAGAGNYGQMDLVAALEWVRDNIEAFGGDPDDVTIFGESGGGGKVQHLLASPDAVGLFHKAIIQSGMYPLDTTSLDIACAGGLALQAELGVESLEEMRAIPWEDVVSASEAAVVDLGVAQIPLSTLIGPNVDGGHLPKALEDATEEGDYIDVPLISGMNRDDIFMPATATTGGFGAPRLVEDMGFYADLFDSPVYAYIFDHVMSGWAAEGGVAYHGIELVYVFNYPESAYSHHLLGLTGFPPGDPPPIGWSETDTEVADTMMTMWTNFAKTGDPGFDWEPYTSAVKGYLEVSQGGILTMRDPLTIDVFPHDGVLVHEGPMDGLYYVAAAPEGARDRYGYTDEDGAYVYFPGREITFYFGGPDGIEIGSGTAVASMGLDDISDEDMRVDALIFNALDTDNDPSNGTTFPGVDFPGDLEDFQADVTTFENDVGFAVNSGSIGALRTAIEDFRDALDAGGVEVGLAPIPDAVATTSGDIVGYEVPARMNVWKGIPYAAPPVGELRFAPPAVYEAEEGDIVIATRFGDKCIQDDGCGNEDCLYLNVFAPLEGDDLPVMVWIHGGALIQGSACNPGYDMPDLVHEDVIVVTINYRLNAFGFLPHPALEDPTGNFGLKDQVAALQWVQANIDNFGGDPGNVTIFGESAGGHSVLSLMASEAQDDGLFHKAIVQSGSYSPEQTDLGAGFVILGKPFADLDAEIPSDGPCGGINDAGEIRTCLRGLSVEEIMTTQNDAPGWAWVTPVYAEGTFLPQSINDALDSDEVADVPAMIGTNLNEGTLFAGLFLPDFNLMYTEPDYYDGVRALLNPTGDPGLNDFADAVGAYYLTVAPGTTNLYRNAYSMIWTDATFTVNNFV